MKRTLLVLAIIICLCIPILAADDITIKPTEIIVVKPTLATLTEKELVWTDITKISFETQGKPITKSFAAAGKNKMVQVYPDATITVSRDTETIKQSTNGDVKTELYYGYQKSASQPWSKYYKIENCDATRCRVVRADFATRQVWIEEILLSQAGIAGIPDYDALPVGVSV